MTMDKKTITVLGAGYVGLTTAALLAHSGFKVYVVEPNKKRLDVIKTGRSFFYEEGLDEVIDAAIKSGNLNPTDSYTESVPNSSIVFSSVGTPDNPDGSSNLTYVFSAAEEASKYLKSGSIYVQKSTVPVGTGERIKEIFSKLKNKIDYVSNPEFLREGTALYDTLYFDRVVAGNDNKETVEQVLDIYRELEKHRDKIAKIAKIDIKPHQGQYISTSLNSAELIKVTSNAFLALKISFANSIAKLADKVDADITEVMDAVGADKRIGRAFLNAGRGYGGGCFPKDVSGLIASGIQNGVHLDIMEAAQSLNETMPGYIVEKLQAKIGGSLQGKKVAVLGLSFKAGTSDVRRSPGILLANSLNKSGAIVTTFDPQANHEAAEELRKGIVQCESIEDTIRGVDAMIVATEWPEFLAYSPSKFAKATKNGKIFVDAINRFSKADIKNAGLNYIGVGR
ncbi:MAG: UDP-glucose/GDP-mannose dehydrogenase family protein [Candidatus Saccharimonadales bacterium]